MTTTLSMRADTRLTEAVRAAARAHGLTASEWLKRAAYSQIRASRFECEHMNASGVTSVSCWQCGPLAPAR